MDSMKKSDQKDLDKFLAQVDDIEKIVKGFTSEELSKQNEAIKKADEILNEKPSTGYNRTVINKNAYKDEAPGDGIQCTGPEMSKDAFLSALEADANQRAAARKERHRKANELKDEANADFKDGKYELALEKYSNAIKIANDLAPLYTNRAMAFIKMERYDDAINDCDFALRVESSWIKAFVVKGNALRLMKKFDEAIKSYKNILEINEKKEKLVQDYVSQAQEEQKIEEQEQRARKSMTDNKFAAEGIAKLIHTIGTRVEVKHEGPEEMFTYYAGGFRVLATELRDDNKRIIFRTEGGFKILAAKPYLREVLLQKAFSFGRQSDFAQSFLITVQAACLHCPQNMTAFLEEELMSEILINLLEINDKQVKSAAILCFLEFAHNDKMIDMMLDLYTAPRIAKDLLSDDTIKLKLLEEAVTCLNQYAANKRFRQDVAKEFDTLVLQVYLKFVDEIGHNQRKELPQCLQNLCIFTRNEEIYEMIANHRQSWESLLSCMDRCIHVMDQNAYREELLIKMFHLLEILLLRKNTAIVEIAPRLAACILPLLNEKKQELAVKCLVTLTRTLEKAKESVKCFQSASGLLFIKKIYKLMKSDDISTRTYALKIICFCGQTDPTVLKNIPKFDKRYNTIRKVLSLDENEADVINQGHAALLLGYLSQLPSGLDPLVDYNDDASNVVKHLLELCRYAKHNNTRYNCVIALGKMAKNDGRILGEVHRFDGINILARNKPPNV